MSILSLTPTPTPTPTPTAEAPLADVDPTVTIYAEGAEPILLNADERQASELLSTAMASVETFFGSLDATQRTRLRSLYDLPSTSSDALHAIVESAQAQVSAGLASLLGRKVDLAAVRIHTARFEQPAISEPLWDWLSRGTALQLAAPRLTRDAIDFVDNSWLSADGHTLLSADGSPLTVAAVIELGRQLDIGQFITDQCQAWAGQPQVVRTMRQEADGRFERALLNALKVGRISAEQYAQLCVSAGLALPGSLPAGDTVLGLAPASGHFMLRVEGHALPVAALSHERSVYIVVGSFPEPRLFIADAEQGLTALQVFGNALRQNLWNTRRWRNGWSWSLLSPAAQQAVTMRMPQPLPAANQYPADAYWVSGYGAYLNQADYQRYASEVRLTAPLPLTRSSVAQHWASAHVQLMSSRVAQRFTPNQGSTVDHALRIGTQWLATTLDVLLIAVPGQVRFPGRALLFKALFAKQLAVDLPLSAVQAKWQDVGQSLLDFFETVLEMQAGRKAGKLLRSRLGTVSRLLGETPVGADPENRTLTAAQRLREMLPAALRSLDDAALTSLMQRAGVDEGRLERFWKGQVALDMGLAAAASEALDQRLMQLTLAHLAQPSYTQLPPAVEWPLLGWLAESQQLRIEVADEQGRPLRAFAPEQAPAGSDSAALPELRLSRHGRWRYRSQSSSEDTLDSPFAKVVALLHGEVAPSEQLRLTQVLRDSAVEQLRGGEHGYRLQRAFHHDARPRASVPAGEGGLLAQTVSGASEVASGQLQGADAGTISLRCERSVAHPTSLQNLAKARYQADLAALAGGYGRRGRQTLSHAAQQLYFSSLLGLFAERGVQQVAIRIQAEGRSIAAWGAADAVQVLLLRQVGEAQAYTYTGVLPGNDLVLPAADSPTPLSEVLLRLLDDSARDLLGFAISDAAALNDAVVQRVAAGAAQGDAAVSPGGVPLQGDPLLAECLQDVVAPAVEVTGVGAQGDQYWLPWGHGAIAVQREGNAWRAQRTDAGAGPLLQRQFGEWRRLQEPLPEMAPLVHGPVSGSLLLARLNEQYRRDPFARVYHDDARQDASGAGGGSYIAWRGEQVGFYRIKPAEAGALEWEITRQGGTGGGLWVREARAGLWQLARTLPGGMDNDGNEPWRPWLRPQAQPLPHHLGLVGSEHARRFVVTGGTHKAVNRFFPFVRPYRLRAQYAQRLEAAPAAIRAPTSSDNIAAKVDLFQHQWGLPLDLSALPFFRMPGVVASEVKHIDGALIADLIGARLGEAPIISRVIEPMSGSGFYSNYVRACGFRGEVLVNDINPLVTHTQREIVRQPDAVKQHILAIKQTLLELWAASNPPQFDPQTLRVTFPDVAAATAFVNSPEVKRFREDVRQYFYSTVETQFIVVDGQIQISPDSSFLLDPVNGELQARAYIAAAFYLMQTNSARNNAAVRINETGRLDLPMAIVIKDGGTGSVLMLGKGLANLDGLNYLSYLHAAPGMHTSFSTGDGWQMLRVEEGRSNLGDLALLSGHFSDVYLREEAFITQVREQVMPFVRNRGRLIMTNAYSPYKERAFIEMGLRVLVMENRSNGFLLAVSDSVARDVGLPNG